VPDRAPRFASFGCVRDRRVAADDSRPTSASLPFEIVVAHSRQPNQPARRVGLPKVPAVARLRTQGGGSGCGGRFLPAPVFQLDLAVRGDSGRTCHPVPVSSEQLSGMKQPGVEQIPQADAVVPLLLLLRGSRPLEVIRNFDSEAGWIPNQLA
jgi:hypothetical protein